MTTRISASIKARMNKLGRPKLPEISESAQRVKITIDVLPSTRDALNAMRNETRTSWGKLIDAAFPAPVKRQVQKKVK